MKKRVREIIDFQEGQAEITLPKGATEINLLFEGQKVYLCATADLYETESEKYLISSYDKKQEFKEESEVKFLKEVYIIGAGYFFWYYKKIS